MMPWWMAVMMLWWIHAISGRWLRPWVYCSGDPVNDFILPWLSLFQDYVLVYVCVCWVGGGVYNIFETLPAHTKILFCLFCLCVYVLGGRGMCKIWDITGRHRDSVLIYVCVCVLGGRVRVKFETLPVGTKPGTITPWITWRKELGVEKRRQLTMIFREKMRDRVRIAWNCSKGNFGDTFEKWGWAHMGFSKHVVPPGTGLN